MRKITKWLSVVLCLTLFASMAMGSGSSSSGETKDVVSTDSVISDSQSADSSDTSAKESESAEDEYASAEESESTEGENAAASIIVGKQILVDQDDILITATEYATDSIWEDGIKLLIENNSTVDVMVGCDALIVNDYMISDLFVSEVAAGKKANETMYLSSSELKAAGIDTVGQIEIYFHVSDSTTYDTLFNTDCVTIQTSEYANMDITANDDGMELYNQDGVKIIGKTVDESSFWGTAILLYCENTSGKNIGISVDDMSINGFMMSPFFSTTVYDGKKSIDDITIFSSDLEENGIEQLEEIELKFHIYDADSYSTITDSDPITFSAQ